MLIFNQRIYWVLLCACLAINGMGETCMGATSTIQGIRLGIHENHTRMVIELNKKPDFKVIKKEGEKGLEVKLLNVHPASKNPPEKGKGHISGYQITPEPKNSVAIKISTTQPAHFLKAYVMEKKGDGPYRLVLDVAPTRGIKKTSTPIVGPTPMGNIPMPFVKPLRRVVVIDAGHGGQDPGATSPKGYEEKNITLAVAREMKRIIDKTGKYTAVLTRTKDEHIPLRTRFAVAREAQANLLISLHADSNPNKNVRGVSIYTLSENASDKEAQRLAEKENAADFLEDLKAGNTDEINVKNILIDLSQTRARNHSVEFADMVTAKFLKHELLPKNSHRSADFAVLKAPDVASVLIELGYLSNEKDEKRLSSKEYQGKIALLIVSAIDDYFEHVKS